MILSQMELDMTKANYATKVKFELLVATTPSLQGKFVFAFHEEWQLCLSFLHISHNPIWDNGPTLLDYELNYIILFVLMAKKLVVKHPFNIRTIRLQGIT